MKKTLITLLSLAGVAMAATDGYLTNPDALTWDDALTLTTPANGVLNSGNSGLYWDGAAACTKSWELSFNLTNTEAGNQYLFGTVHGGSGADGYTLSITSGGAVKLNSNKSNALASTGDGAVTLNTPVSITLTFVNYVDEVTAATVGGQFTLTVGEQDALTYTVAEAAVFTPSNAGSGGSRLWTNSGKQQFSNVTFKTGGNMIIPEPATATLSLLALCGLAARRRRK